MKATESSSIVRRLGGRFFRFHTIQSRLLANLLLLVLIPTALVVMRTAVMGWRNGQNQVTQQLESVATLKEAEIERWLNDLTSNLAMILDNPESDLVVQFLAEGGDGEITIQQAQANWTHLSYYAGAFDELFLMDTQGRVVLSSGPTAVGTLHSNQDYFEEGLKGSFVNPPLYSPTLERMSVIVAEPVVDNLGQTIGVLGGRANITTLSEIMQERAGLGETGETYLVGDNHALLTNVLLIESNVQKADSVVFVRSEGAHRAIDSHQNGSGLYLNYADEPVIGVYRWLSELQVAILAEQNRDEAFAPLRAELLIELSIAGVVLLVAIAIAFYVTRNLTLPLQDLTATAQEIVQGNYRITTNIDREDEIGTLAAAFNQMTAHLNKLITNFEKHVNELEAAQISLQESEYRYRTLFNSSPVMMYSVDSKGKLVSVNRHWLETMGYELDEALGRTSVSFLTEESARYVREIAFPKFLADGYLYDLPLAFVTKSGRVIDTLLSATARYDAEGQFQYAITVVQDITDRKRAEEKLRRSEERNRAVLESIPDIIFRVNREGIILDYKAEQESQLAIPADQIIGSHVSKSSTSPELLEEMMRLIHHAIETGEIVSYEYELEVPAGPHSFETRIIKSGDDEVITFVRDITERKQIEKSLRESEERLRQAVRVSQIGIFDDNHTGKDMYMSPEVRKIYGWGLDEEISLELFFSQIYPDDRERIIAAIQAAHDPTGNGSFDVEHRILNRDGTVHWVSTKSQTFFESEGSERHALHTVGAILDITESRLAAEAALVKDRAIESAINAIVIADSEGIITYVNPSLLDMWGYENNQEVLEKPIRELWTYLPEDVSRVMEAMQTEGSWVGEVFAWRKDGTKFEAQLSASLIKDESGQPAYMMGSLMDITQRKLAQERLRQSEERMALVFNSKSEMQTLIRVEEDGRLIMETANEAYQQAIKALYPEVTLPIMERERAEFMASLNISQDVIEQELPMYREALKSGQTVSYELPIQAADNIITLQISLEPVFDDNHRCTHLLWSGRDITERKHAQETLLKHAQVLYAMAEGVNFIDSRGIIRFTNSAFDKMFGYERNELIGQPVGVLNALSPQENEKLVKEILTTLDNGNMWEGELTNVKKNGDIFYSYVRISGLQQRDELWSVAVQEDITVRKQTEEQIRAALQEKEVLLKEIHHRVKNNMQVISSLLGLQSDYITDESVVEMIQESRSRVRSMALVHEQLYQSTDLARIDFAEYINSLTSYLLRLYGHLVRNVGMIVDVNAVPLSVETAVPLGLIINELVTNALKHAFPDHREGSILVQLKKQEDRRLCLVIEDDGVGLPENLEIRRSPSLGLTIVSTLVDQLQATFCQVSPGVGCRFEIAFRTSEKDGE